MIEVNKSKLEDARKYIEEAHKLSSRDCSCCGGHGGPSFNPCGLCKGLGRQAGESHLFFKTEQWVDYWNARALVAECEIDELKKQLEESKKFKPTKTKVTLMGRVKYSAYATRLFHDMEFVEARAYCERRPLGYGATYILCTMDNNIIATFTDSGWIFASGCLEVGVKGAGQKDKPSVHKFTIKGQKQNGDIECVRYESSFTEARDYCESRPIHDFIIYKLFTADNELVATLTDSGWEFAAGENAASKAALKTSEKISSYVIKTGTKHYESFVSEKPTLAAAKKLCDESIYPRCIYSIYNNNELVATRDNGVWSFAGEIVERTTEQPEKVVYTIKARKGDSPETILETTSTLKAAKHHCVAEPLGTVYTYNVYRCDKWIASWKDGEWITEGVFAPPKLPKSNILYYVVKVWDSYATDWIEDKTKQFSCLQEAKTYGSSIADSQCWIYIHKEERCVAYLANSNLWREEGNI